MSEPNSITVSAVLLALQAAGSTTRFDAGHVAAALGRHRASMRLEGSGLPAVVSELERAFAAIALGPREATTGQDGAEMDPQVASVQLGEHDDDETDLLTREQVARRLRCSESTVKRRERAGALNPVSHGRIVRHRREDIERFIDEGGTRP